MSTATTNFGAVATSNTAPAKSMFARLASTLSAYSAYRRTVAELSSLSDRQLADIGLQRGDIRDVAHGVSNR